MGAQANKDSVLLFLSSSCGVSPSILLHFAPQFLNYLVPCTPLPHPDTGVLWPEAWFSFHWAEIHPSPRPAASSQAGQSDQDPPNCSRCLLAPLAALPTQQKLLNVCRSEMKEGVCVLRAEKEFTPQILAEPLQGALPQ